MLSLFMPPLVVVSNALVALVWLRLGPVSGGVSVAIALVAATVIASFAGNPLAPAALMMSFWLPVIVMSMVLRTTVSLNLALLAGAALALAGVLITYLVVDEPSEAWRGLLDAVTQAAEQSTSGDSADRIRVTEWLNNAGQWMTGFSAATQFILAALSLLLARVWQARLFNPGGLQKEFHGLRFGQAAGAAGLLIVLASVFLHCLLYTSPSPRDS